MIINELAIKGAFSFSLKKINDDRGFFARIYCVEFFKDNGIPHDIKQINTSHCKYKGTLRGLHMQISPHLESKFIRCVKGEILDIIVDFRKNSPTFLSSITHKISSNSNNAIYIPEGCLHGYMSLSDDCQVIYSASEFYKPESEFGVRWNDPKLNIELPFNPLHVSEKDLNHKFL